MVWKHLLAALVAFAVFAITIVAAVAALPSLLGLLYTCAPSDVSCGDSSAWAMLITAPVTIPVVLVVAGVLAMMTYLGVVRSGSSN